MKLFKKIIIWGGILLTFVALLGLLINRHETVERAIDIDVHAAAIYNVLIHPEESNNWSPWAQIDPETTKFIYEGHSAGEGAIMKWDSDHSVIEHGVLELVRCVHNKSVRTEYYFGNNHYPSYGNFILDEFDGYTEVTWQFDFDWGPNPFMHIVGLFTTEAKYGELMETGLHSLKSYVETNYQHEEELDIELQGDALVDSLRNLQGGE